jgi:hypothetical protein
LLGVDQDAVTLNARFVSAVGGILAAEPEPPSEPPKPEPPAEEAAAAAGKDASS